jgi:nicotinate-nucleotide adenylyltransferase
MEDLKPNHKKITVLFGGLFDPPHVGHILCAQEVLRSIPDANIIVSPTPVSPEHHKAQQNAAPYPDRLAMCKLNFCQIPQVSVSDFEAKLKPPYYTFLSLRHLRELGYTNLALLIGEDQFWNLHNWKNPGEILLLARLIILKRQNNSAEFLKTRQDLCDPTAQDHINKIYSLLPADKKKEIDAPLFLTDKSHEASSTVLRRALLDPNKNSRLLLEWLRPEVQSYINENNLYKGL